MTKLSPIDEAIFNRWYQNLPTVQAGKISNNPDDPEHFYDFRAAFLAGVQPSENGHFPSQFKLANHPRRFLGGIDTANIDPLDLRLQELLGRPSVNEY